MEPTPQTITVTAPQDYKYVEGQPITFDVPVSSFDITKFAPKEIAEKPYFKEKIKSPEDLFKAFDGAQTLLGSKPKFGVPADDAPQEDWDAFYKASRPEKEDDYAFEEDPNAPEELKSTPEFKSAIKKMFFDHGIPKKVALNLQKNFDKITMGVYQAEKAKREAIDKQFLEMVKPIVGEKTEDQTKNFAQSKRILEYLLPKELHPFISKTNNEGLALMTALTQAVEKKYLKQDELPGSGGEGTGTTKEEMQTKARALMLEMRNLDPMNPKRAELQKQIDDYYKKIALM